MTKHTSAKEVISTPWLFVDLVVLYIVWSVIGVALEGVYTQVSQGGWETHVVSMIGPFCVIYGFGAVLYYIASAVFYEKPFVLRFLIFAITGTLFELLCGLLLLYGLNMKAWDYSMYIVHYKGIICPEMFFVWGLIGIGFFKLFPFISAMLSKLHRQPFGIIAGVLAVILAADLIFTGFCIVRWKNRYVEKIQPVSAIERMIDENYPDDYMRHRFIEWRFLQDIA